MEKDNEQNEEREPWLKFHVFALELWFWRVAVPVTLIISLLK